MNSISKYKLHISLLLSGLLFLWLTGIIFVKEESDISVFVSAQPSSPPILIIDAGHGGADGGALAADGTKESVLNLSVAEKLRSLCGVFGINTIMTRETEELAYPKDKDTIAKMKRWDQHRRLDLINSMENAFFLSIHQNKFPDPRPFGPQVIYGKSEESKLWGEICHDLLNANLCPDNRRLASEASENIYLIKNAACPSILVECGFLSNPDELEKLKADDYQIELSEILLVSFLNYFC